MPGAIVSACIFPVKMVVQMLPMRNLKIRRTLIIIFGIAVIHAVVIYGFIAVKVRPDNKPRLVYTHIVANPNIVPITNVMDTYIALPQAPCVALRESGPATSALPTCTEIRPAPSEHQLLGEDGFIGLTFTIDANGRVQQPTVSTSSGAPALDQAALEQIRDTWEFTPCQINENENCTRSIRFRWQL